MNLDYYIMCYLNLFSSFLCIFFLQNKHGKTCSYIDMLYNDETNQIFHIIGTTDVTFGFLKQGRIYFYSAIVVVQLLVFFGGQVI